MATVKLGEKRIEAPAGSNLRQVLLGAGIPLDSPCGGRGSCGKCRVYAAGEMDPPSALEQELLGSGLKLGLRLACQVTLRGSLKIELPKAEDSSTLPEPTVTLGEDRLLGAAVDLGTTTLAGYLLDLTTGNLLASASRLNPQISYGADLISRLSFAAEEGSRQLTEIIRTGISELLGDLAGQVGAGIDQIRRLVLVGNSAMHHLWWGLETKTLAQAPYEPVSTEPIQKPASKVGLQLYPGAQVYFLPLVAGFVGADTVAAVLATGLATKGGKRLLVDIGTNGEMVLATEGKLFSVATAAGPALEGAEISCGMRGVAGAIETVHFDDTVQYSVIGKREPVGICGSGLVALLAELLRAGAIDKTGRLLTAREFLAQGGSEMLARKLTAEGFQLAVGPQGPIILTGRDIRKLQLAKGAIRAGIEILLRYAAVAYEELTEIILAGAFGSFLNKESALRIGLLPPVAPQRVQSVGNAAGEGARLVLLSTKMQERAERVARKIKYLELATRSDFQEQFMEAMLF